MAVVSSTSPAGTAEREERAARTFNPLLVSYYLIVGAVLLLLMLGLIMVLSSSAVQSIQKGRSPYGQFLNQAVYAGVGLVAAFIASRVPVRAWRYAALPIILAALAFQALVFVPGIGRTYQGNRAWVIIGGQSFQPAEALKLALVVWLAAVLAVKRPLLNKWRHVIIPVVPMVALCLGMVLLGHDMGTAMIMAALCFGALYVAGVPLRMLVTFGLASVGGLVAFLLKSGDIKRLDRIDSFLQGHPDSAGGGYQTLHGLYALGSGGFFGLGLGNSREKWLYLPEAQNDFIFAIIGEELGLVGTLLVLVLFGLLMVGLMQVVLRHKDSFTRIVAGTLAAWILVQALVNIAVVIGLLPVLGVPLPLVSAGGSALITILGGVGVVMSGLRSDPEVGAALKANLSAITGAVAVVGRGRRRNGVRGVVA